MDEGTDIEVTKEIYASVETTEYEAEEKEEKENIRREDDQISGGRHGK